VVDEVVGERRARERAFLQGVRLRRDGSIGGRPGGPSAE
jgi:hypothetical protein